MNRVYVFVFLVAVAVASMAAVASSGISITGVNDKTVGVDENVSISPKISFNESKSPARVVLAKYNQNKEDEKLDETKLNESGVAELNWIKEWDYDDGDSETLIIKVMLADSSYKSKLVDVRFESSSSSGGGGGPIGVRDGGGSVSTPIGTVPIPEKPEHQAAVAGGGLLGVGAIIKRLSGG